MIKTNGKKMRIGKRQKDAFSFFKCLKKEVTLFCIVPERKASVGGFKFQGEKLLA